LNLEERLERSVELSYNLHLNLCKVLDGFLEENKEGLETPDLIFILSRATMMAFMSHSGAPTILENKMLGHQLLDVLSEEIEVVSTRRIQTKSTNADTSEESLC